MAVPGDSSRVFRNSLASTLSALALGPTHLIRAKGSPTEYLAAGLERLGLTAVRGIDGVSRGRARPSPSGISKNKPTLGSFSGINDFCHLPLATCPLLFSHQRTLSPDGSPAVRQCVPLSVSAFGPCNSQNSPAPIVGEKLGKRQITPGRSPQGLLLGLPDILQGYPVKFKFLISKTSF